MDSLPILGILIYLTTAFLMPLLSKAGRRAQESVFLAANLAVPAIQLILLIQGWEGGWRPIVYILGARGMEWSHPVRILLEVDGLSAAMGFIIALVASASAFYSRKYIREASTKYYTLFSLLEVGMLGMVLTGDIFNLYVFLEITSISAYALVAFRKDRWEAVEAGMKYMVMGSLASSLILVSIALLYAEYGNLAMAQLAISYRDSPTTMARVALAGFIAGFLMKGGAVPVHMWLADAHPAAPSTISALLSGLVIKVGLYSAARLAFTVFWKGSAVPLLGWTVVAIGILTIFFGNLLAAFQKDAKRLLAYSSVGQIGYVVTGLGIALVPGVDPDALRVSVDGAVFHILNHAILKAMLFLAVGAVIHELGTRDIASMGGVSRRMPLTSAIILLGAMGVIGAPPMNGFVSKWMLYEGTAVFNPVVGAVAVLGTAFSTMAYGRLFYALLGRETKIVSERSPSDPSGWMKWPMVFLAAVSVLFGILPRIPVVYIVRPARAALLSPQSYASWLSGTPLSPELPPLDQPISIFGVWVPAIFVAVFALSILIFYAIKNMAGYGVREVGEATKAYLSGEDEEEFEALQLPGTGVLWGLGEALRSLVDTVKREHSGILQIYLFWLVVLYAILILVWGGM